jgi:hypothetical protein
MNDVPRGSTWVTVVAILALCSALFGAFVGFGYAAASAYDPTGYEERGPGLFMLFGPLVPLVLSVSALVGSARARRRGGPMPSGWALAVVGLALSVLAWLFLWRTWDTWF